jgi:hypothetical protein
VLRTALTTTTHRRKPARASLALDGNPGGLGELVIPEPEKQVELLRVAGVNPEI